MKCGYFNLIFFLLMALLGGRQCLAQTSAAEIKAIIDVHVVPMDNEEVLEHQTVLIEGNRIARIGPVHDVQIPPNAQRIDGKNMYLMPGLMDMHVHLTRRDLPLFLANGVTTVRNLNGDTSHLSMRAEVAQRKLVGPRIYTSGPLMTGPKTRWRLKAVPTSADEARQMVSDQKKMGFDFIKVYDGLTAELFDAIMDRAVQEQLPVAGHIPADVGLKGVLSKKMTSIEHMEKIAYAYFGQDISKEKMTEIARMVKDAGTWLCPTLAVQEIFSLNAKGDFVEKLTNPEMKYVEAGTMEWWTSFAAPKRSGPLNDHQVKMQGFFPFQVALTKAMFDEGVPLVAGTDSPNPGMVHGFALHEELRNLVAAGLTPYQALKTATTNGAVLLKKGNELGRIKEGMLADLVLVEKNPLTDITHCKTLVGVMADGAWYPKEKLDEMLSRLRAD